MQCHCCPAAGRHAKRRKLIAISLHLILLPHNTLWEAHPVATEDMSRVKRSLKPIRHGCGTAMAHWSRPQTSNFCIAPVPPKWLLCAHPAEDQTISEPTVITWRIPKGRTQAISYTKKNEICRNQASGRVGMVSEDCVVLDAHNIALDAHNILRESAYENHHIATPR